MSDVQPPAAPVCYRHPRRETYVRCSRCDRPICPECMRSAAVGHHCPECVAEGRRSQRPARGAFGGDASIGSRGYVTKTLIAINVVMLGLSVLSAGSAVALGGGGLGGLLGSATPLHYWADLVAVPVTYTSGGRVVAHVNGVAGGDYYRLVTSMFMHYGLIHLGLNMWALWIVGRMLETALGPARFLSLYLLSGLGGSVAGYLFGSPTALGAGASGAVFGLFGALFVVVRRLGGNAWSLMPLIVINLVFTFTVPGIAVAVHLGGLVTGALVAVGLAYAPRAARTAVQSVVVVGSLILLVAATWIHTTMIMS